VVATSIEWVARQQRRDAAGAVRDSVFSARRGVPLTNKTCMLTVRPHCRTNNTVRKQQRASGLSSSAHSNSSHCVGLSCTVIPLNGRDSASANLLDFGSVVSATHMHAGHSLLRPSNEQRSLRVTGACQSSMSSSTTSPSHSRPDKDMPGTTSKRAAT
jgi:hypothetical protein